MGGGIPVSKKKDALMSKQAKRLVASYQAKSPTLEAATKGATSYANLFDEVISVQVLFNPDGACACSKASAQHWPYSFAVFGCFENGLPKRVGTDSKGYAEDTLADHDFICERPMLDGTILMYRRTTADIKALIAHLSEVGVPIPEALTVGYWKKLEACTGSKDCSTKSCTSGSCSTCNLGNGNYCCC
jgi:hypothetical protein